MEKGGQKKENRTEGKSKPKQRADKVDQSLRASNRSISEHHHHICVCALIAIWLRARHRRLEDEDNGDEDEDDDDEAWLQLISVCLDVWVCVFNDCICVHTKRTNYRH